MWTLTKAKLSEYSYIKAAISYIRIIISKSPLYGLPLQVLQL